MVTEQPLPVVWDMESLFSSLKVVAPKVILVLPLAMVSKTTVIIVPVPVAEEDTPIPATSKLTDPPALESIKVALEIKLPAEEETYCSLAASKFRVTLAPKRSVTFSTTTLKVN